jgi:hypothetical protein
VLLTAQFDAPFARPLVAQNAETTAPATIRKAKQQTRKDPETREIGVTRRPTSLHQGSARHAGGRVVATYDSWVAKTDDDARTENGHVRNDTRDVSRHIHSGQISLICRKNGVARDRW